MVRITIVAIIVIAVLIALAMLLWDKSRNPYVPAELRTANNKAVTKGSQAIRLLDQILVDPTLIGSSDWREKAQQIVDDWHGK